MSKDTGGSAFPTLAYWDEKTLRYSDEGMTLRDYFAAKADNSGECPCNQYDHTECAEWAFARADAMLEARKK